MQAATDTPEPFTPGSSIQLNNPQFCTISRVRGGFYVQTRTPDQREGDSQIFTKKKDLFRWLQYYLLDDDARIVV